MDHLEPSNSIAPSANDSGSRDMETSPTSSTLEDEDNASETSSNSIASGHPTTSGVPSLNGEAIKKLLSEASSSNDTGVVSAKLEALEQRIDKCLHDDVREFWKDHNGGRVLLALMTKWSDIESIQGWCMECIRAIIRRKYPRCIAFFLANGALDLAVLAMKKFPSSYDPIQWKAVALICRLFSENEPKNIGNLQQHFSSSTTGGRALDTMQYFVNHLDGLMHIVDSMSRFPDRYRIKILACWLLHRLCHLGVSKEAVKEAKVLEAVKVAFEMFPEDIYVFNAYCILQMDFV